MSIRTCAANSACIQQGIAFGQMCEKVEIVVNLIANKVDHSSEWYGESDELQMRVNSLYNSVLSILRDSSNSVVDFDAKFIELKAIDAQTNWLLWRLQLKGIYIM